MGDLLFFCLRMDFFGLGEDERREVEREEEEPPSSTEAALWREDAEG
jgi:hypothetical protein